MSSDPGAGKGFIFSRLQTPLFRAPRDVQDPSLFHKLSLITLLLWGILLVLCWPLVVLVVGSLAAKLAVDRRLKVAVAIALAAGAFTYPYGWLLAEWKAPSAPDPSMEKLLAMDRIPIDALAWLGRRFSFIGHSHRLHIL
jgi:hypothetical protein